MIRIDETKCTGCGLCADACRESAIWLEDRLARTDPGKCTDCGACADACPKGAIEMVEARAPALRPATRPVIVEAQARPARRVALPPEITRAAVRSAPAALAFIGDLARRWMLTRQAAPGAAGRRLGAGRRRRWRGGRG